MRRQILSLPILKSDVSQDVTEAGKILRSSCSQSTTHFRHRLLLVFHVLSDQ
jgi:hypothetical protein